MIAHTGLTARELGEVLPGFVVFAVVVGERRVEGDPIELLGDCPGHRGIVSGGPTGGTADVGRAFWRTVPPSEISEAVLQLSPAPTPVTAAEFEHERHCSRRHQSDQDEHTELAI